MFCPVCKTRYPALLGKCPVHKQALVEAAPSKNIRRSQTVRTGIVLSGRYRISGAIGAGGMARVYVGDDLTKNEPVAIKMLDATQANNKDARARFVREAQIALTIDHPNVVRAIDMGERADGQVFLVMEHLAGETVGAYIEREGALPPHLAFMAIADAARGLAAVHEAGTVHRDVKPDNLFLVGDIGAPTCLKVIDFGLARVKTKGRLTAIGTVLGSSFYIAPEQIVGDPVDARTDVYSLGATAHRMLSGQLPFDALELRELLAQQLRSAPRALPEGAGLARFAPILTSALRKRPENRYATMLDLLADVERAGKSGELPHGAPLAHEPDVFEPSTDIGRTAMETVLAPPATE